MASKSQDQPKFHNLQQHQQSTVYEIAGFENENCTTISLNGLVQKALSDDHCPIGRDMREHLSKGQDVPKKLIYTLLKEALDKANVNEPILITDRQLSIPHEHQKRENIALETQLDVRPSIQETVKNVNHEENKSENLSQINSPKESCRKHKILKRIQNSFLPLDDDPVTRRHQCCGIVLSYFKKMRGGHKRPPYDRPLEALQSLLVSFIGIVSLTAMDYFLLAGTDYTMVIGSFGATAVLVFCALKSPLAQPRNVLGGHTLAAVIGVAFQLLLGKRLPWLAASLAVSISIAVMSITNTVHPPAGATALIAVYSNDLIHRLGFMYVLVPVITGALILLVIAVLVNNLFPSRKYPLRWL